MTDFFTRLFDPSGFVPRRVCGEWTPGLVWLHNASDALIWLAYLAIPLVLLVIARRRKDVPFRAVYFLFIAFILTCGFTHFLDVVMFYSPLYRLSGLVKAMTAVASWATVIALFPVLPKALAMRSPQELEREIAERRRVEGELRALHAELEERVGQRTAELEEAVAALRAENEERKRVEGQLWASREQLRLVTDNAPVMLVHCDTERRYKFVNRAYAECFGLTPREVVGRTIPEVVGERAYERIRANVDAALAGERVGREVEGPYQGTEKRWLHFTCLPTYSQSGEVDGAIAVILDVTERRKVEELLRSITDTVPALIAYVDVEGRYKLNNRAYEQWFALPKSEMAGRHMRDVLSESAWAIAEPHLRTALAGQAVRYEAQKPHQGGELRWVDATFTPHLDASGAMEGVVMLVNDITDKKEAEIALRKSEARYRVLLEGVPQLVWTCLADGRCDYLSRQWVEYTGVPEADQLGYGWAEMLHAADRPLVWEQWRHAVESGDPLDVEFRIRSVAGEYRWFKTRAVRFSGDDGGEKWFGTNTDIHDRKLAEEKLKESERTYRAIGESIDYGVWVCAPDGRNTYASPSFLKLVGITLEQCSEFGWGDVLHPDEVEGTILAWKECVRVRGKWDREHRFRGVDGRYHPVLARGVPVEDEQGNLLGWAGINLDISRQMQAENALRELNATLEQRVAVSIATIESERRLLDAILEAMPVAVIISEPNGRLVRLNGTCDQVWGLNPFMSGSIDEYGEWVGYWPASGQRVQPHEWALSRALLNGEVCPGELMEIERFGLRDRRFVINSAAPVRGADGKIMAGVVATLDVTDRIKVEAALRESEQRFRAIFHTQFQFIGLMSPDGVVLEANRAALAAADVPEAMVIGKLFWETPWWTHDPDQIVRLQAAVRRAAGGKQDRFEASHPGANGSLIWVDFSISPFHDDDGNVVYLIPEGREITERKRVEIALRESEERFRSAFDSAPIGMALVAQDGRWLQVNRSLCELVGYTEQELLATDFQTITHPDDLDADLGHVGQLLDGTAQTYQMEKRYLHKLGHVVHILLSVSLVRDGSGQPLYFVAQIKDITQQKEDEKALVANEELLRQFIKHSPASIAMFDRDMIYMQASDRWLIDYHLSGRDIIGLSHYEVFPDIPKSWKAVHQRVQAGGVEQCEEDPFERADGSTEWLQWECRPWRDAEGEVGGIIMFTQVITERKVIAERVKASLREKEVLLKEIHHRVKNNLQVVSTLLDLQSGHTTDPAATEMFKESRGRVKSMALIHERLYRSQDMARVDFGEYVRQLADDLHRTYRVSDGIRLELAVDIPALTIDIAIPCGLLLNELISNCFKHAFADTAEGCLRVGLHKDGGANVLTVADDGAGFPAGTDFRNTTSFGLQLVNTMVDQLDGEIALTSDRGTTVTVRFPKESISPAGTLP